MAGYQVQIEGLDELRDKLNGMGAKLDLELATGMEKAVKIVEGSAKKNAPVNFGTLRASITSTVEKSLMGTGVTGIVGTNVEYAGAMEFGTKPYVPPIEPLILWSRRKFKIDERQAISVAKKIRRYISAKGLRARPYLRPAVEENRSRISEIFRNAVRRAIQ